MPNNEPPSDDQPAAREVSRIVPDTSALKALAHPDRLRMLGILRFDGPDTASGLARRLGLNSGATSYHLRQLAQHGFIAEADDLGNKRDRWWRARHQMTGYDPAELSGEALDVGLAMAQAVISQHAVFMQQAIEQFPNLPVEWRKASNASDYTVSMTPEQALALKERLTGLLWDAVRQSPPLDGPQPPGTRKFMVMLHSFPFPGFEEDKKETDD